jgi:hypothetical protein
VSSDERRIERERRIGLNEAVFREVNERLRKLADRFDPAGRPMDMVCECGNVRCDERIRLTPAEYEELRADPRLFAIVPGHEKDDVEDVVDHRDGYDVVRKHSGEPTRVARATDPRST